MATGPDPRQNHLLAALPADEWARWLPALEPVDMPLGEVLYESGIAMTHVYFPTTPIVSLLYVMEDGASAEIAVVGNEGIVGVSLFMGGETTPSRSVVQSAGQGFRMRGQLLKDEFNRSGPVLHLLLRYTQALIRHIPGGPREGGTEAAISLQQAGLIRYRRGHITVLDRRGLEQRTCECY